MKEGSTI